MKPICRAFYQICASLVLSLMTCSLAMGGTIQFSGDLPIAAIPTDALVAAASTVDQDFSGSVGGVGSVQGTVRFVNNPTGTGGSIILTNFVLQTDPTASTQTLNFVIDITQAFQYLGAGGVLATADLDGLYTFTGDPQEGSLQLISAVEGVSLIGFGNPGSTFGCSRQAVGGTTPSNPDVDDCLATLAPEGVGVLGDVTSNLRLEITLTDNSGNTGDAAQFELPSSASVSYVAPEPSSLLLLAGGIAGLAALRRSK